LHRNRASTTSLLTDEELLDAIRATSDNQAYGELWRRHSGAGLRVARGFKHLGEPDDLVAEAFTRIYATLQSGSGPVGVFRPYLYTTIRNISLRNVRQLSLVSDVDLDLIAAPDGGGNLGENALDRSLTAAAFRSLPERWQTVLWYIEVERMSLVEAGDLMGLKPNAVSALAFRARGALRGAWLQSHIKDESLEGEHKVTLARIGEYAQGTLSSRNEKQVAAHLATCVRCSIIAQEVEEVAGRLAIILLPLVLGGAGALILAHTLASGATVLAAAGPPPALPPPATPGTTFVGWSKTASTSGSGLSAASVAMIAAAAIVLAGGTTGAIVLSTGALTAHHAPAAAGDSSQPGTQSTTPPLSTTLPAPTALPAPTVTPTTPPTPTVTPTPPAPTAPPRTVSAPTAPHVQVPSPATIPPPSDSTPVSAITPIPNPGSEIGTATPVLPIIEAPALTGNIHSYLINKAQLTVTGTGMPGAVIQSNGTTVAKVDAAGNWSWSLSGLGEGLTEIALSQQLIGFTTTGSELLSITVDSVAPVAPTVTSTWTPTQLSALQLAGTAEPGATVKIYGQSGAQIGLVTADSTGVWRAGVLDGLQPSVANLTLTQTDLAGNVSPTLSIGPFAFVPVFVGPLDGGTAASPNLSVTLNGWPNRAVSLTLNGQAGGTFTFDSTGSMTRTLAANLGSLAPGIYTLTARYSDGTPSVNSATFAFTVAGPSLPGQTVPSPAAPAQAQPVTPTP